MEPSLKNNGTLQTVALAWGFASKVFASVITVLLAGAVIGLFAQWTTSIRSEEQRLAMNAEIIRIATAMENGLDLFKSDVNALSTKDSEHDTRLALIEADLRRRP